MRLLLPRLSLVLFAVFLAGLADIGLYLAFDDRDDMVRSLPGERHEVVGKLPAPVANVNILPRSNDAAQEATRIALLNDTVLSQRGDVPGLSVHFLELRGRVWRGELTVAEGTPPGRHTLSVFPRERLGPAGDHGGASPVAVEVFASPRELRHSFTSLTERLFGFGPWWLVTAVLPLAGLLLYAAFRQSARDDAALQAKGFGPIYKLAKARDHWDMLFGLGRDHGVREGETLVLVDSRGRPVGRIVARRVGPDTAQARFGLDMPVSPSHLVSKLPPAGGNG